MQDPRVKVKVGRKLTVREQGAPLGRERLAGGRRPLRVFGWVGVASLGGLGLSGCVLSRPLPEQHHAAAVLPSVESAGEKVASQILSEGAAGAKTEEARAHEAAEALKAGGTIGAQTVQQPQGTTELSRDQIVNRLKELYGSLESTLRFETGDWSLGTTAKNELREFARLLKLAPDLKVKISGFADNVGTDQSNVALSRKRADAVREVLVEEGVEAAQVSIEAMGEKAPVASNRTPVGRSLNRRVEIETPSG